MNKDIFKYNIISALMYFTRLATTLIIPLHFGKIGFSTELIAIYVAILGFSKTIATFLCGITSDIIGRKAILIISVFAGALVQLGLGFSSSSISIITCLIIDGIAFGAFMSIRGPIITTLSNYEERGSVFGIFAAVSNIIGIFGGLVIGYAMDVFSSRTVFSLLAFIFLLAGLLSISLKIPEEKKSLQSINVKNIKEPILSIPKPLQIILLVNFIQILITAPLWQVIMPLYLTQVYGKTAFFTGIIYSLDSGFSVLSSYIFGKVSDKVKTHKFAFITSFILAAIAILIPFSIKDPILFIILYLLFNIVFSGFSPVLEKIESGTIRDKYKGFDYTLVRIVLGVGTTIGNFISGLFISKNGGYGYFFYVVAIGYLLISFLLIVMQKQRNIKSFKVNLNISKDSI